MSFAGDSQTFRASGIMDGLVQSDQAESKEVDPPAIEQVQDSEIAKALGEENEPESESSSTVAPTTDEDTKASQEKKKAPRKLIEEEKRAVGRIGREIWKTYILACGGGLYWTAFLVAMILAAASPVLENGWLK